VDRPGFVGDFILWKRGWSHGRIAEAVFDEGQRYAGCLRKARNLLAALFGPLIIGTQFVAAIIVAGTVTPLEASPVITVGTAVLASAIARGMVAWWA
jgi:hypothetical protein